MNPISTPAGGRVFLDELEIDVCTELTLAETGPPEEDSLGLPIEAWLSDPADDERYELGLHDLLGAVEAMRRSEAEG
ncbi:MAG: hypothetical protein ACRDPF_29580 [Streptosporangiaceae bacterium]